MSIDYCHKHDKYRDTDYVVECPECEEEKEEKEMIYIAEVWSVYADSKTGEVYYDTKINGKEVTIVMPMNEALHLHDKEYIKNQYIKYIKTL
tara:strand:- start:9912 stop:10187 length:276 start_codon:yes stop_codon:yes gene_type:complete